MNYTALAVIAALVALAALLWIALAAKMVADDEEAKARAEGERRKLQRAQQEARKRQGAGGEPSSAK